ncbi:unnamed protein product [Lactuca virosa]|uniref:Uncharacterized protein n=1 Tax=Lactuca virosa TaxID=75947 RepID=A0AAU9PWA5_9ASTR|nr:unnamed protein product [Lactuca virosa]
MEYTLPPPVTEAPPCSVASQMMGDEAGLSNFVEQEESSIMFKVLQHGSWSRIDFRSEKSVVNVVDRPHVTSSNPWIQHFRKAKESLSPQENGTLSTTTQQTSYGNTEVIDQNFVEDSAIEIVTTPYNKKRKNTSAVSKLGNGQAASFWHLSCNGNGR